MQQHNRRQFLGQTVLLGTGLFLPASLFPLGAVSATSSDEDRLRFLQGFGARLTPFLYRYNGSQRVAALPFRGHKLSSDGEAWECVVQQGKTPANADAMDIQFSFTLKKRDAFSTGVAAVFDLADWNPEMYVLIPASVYNGNRNRVVDRNYAAGLDRSDLYRKDLPLTTGPLPQLSPMEGTPSKLEVSVCNTTTPAVVLYNRASKRAFVVLTEQGSVFGDHGFTITESADRKSASLAICAPGVRERKPLFVGFEESPDRGAHWAQGSTLTLRLRVYIFDAPGIPAVLDRFHAVRKDVTGMNHPRNLIPFSEVVAMMTKRIDHRFYNGSHSFYCPENATWISYGWIGGLMDTFPMLVLGDQSHLERVIQTFDFAIPGGQGPAGYFYGATDQTGRNFGREGYDEYPEIVLTRKNADLLFWLIKQFLVLKVQGRGNAIKPEWETGVRRLADAFVNTWRQEGQWGNFLNNRTGGIAVYNTTSGAMAIGGLALASAYYDHPPYLQLASEAALFYYDRDFQALGMTTGGCADILQNADSETASGLMTALMALYEITGDGQWLERSSHLAHLLATWTVSFDYQLPPDTELGRLGAKLTGAVWASTQNKHAAPGICTSSGDPLFRIYRATGDTRYAQLLHDIIHAHAEGIRADGTITERLNYCDADGTRGFRGAPGSTGWNELNGILMAMEIPGIYVRVDTGVIYVFDHVVARILRRDGASADIEITNPTPFRADISLLVENAQLSEKPLGYTTFLSWPKIIVDAGETRVTTVTMGCFSQEYRTSSFVMQLNDKGQVTSFQHNGIQYAAINNPGWLLQIVNKGDTLQPVKAVFGKGNIHLTYPDGTIADVKVTLRRSYITLVLLAINKAVDAVKWGPFNTSISDTIGNTVGVVRSGAYAIGLQCLNKKTTGGQLSNEEGAIFDRGTTAVAKPFGSSLQAFTINRSHDRKISVWGQWPDVPVKGIPDGDVSGSAIAIFGSEPANVLAVIKSITQEEGLPYAQWKGQWIKQSDEVGRPYMITTFSESDIDTFLLCAKEMGMAGVYHEGPFETWGHFVLNQTLFPHGISGFKACVEKAHAMGLRLGFHTLSNFITTNDPFVTPKPDPRLALAGSSELIENVSADATEILVKDNHYFQLKSALNSIRIGEEIIRYASVTDQPPFRLTGCVRGAFGTNRSAHEKGEQVGRLIDHPYKVFFPDWDLQKLVAQNIARFINQTGADQMDFDGHEGTFATGMGDLSFNTFAEDVFRLTDHPVVFGSSRDNHYFWHFNDYLNWGEPWYGSFRQSQTDTRIANQKFYEDNYLPNMLGWFLITAQTSPEDVEWMLARAAGYGAGYALVLRKDALSNPALQRITKLIGLWTAAQRKKMFDPEQKAWLRDVNNEARLLSTDGVCYLQRVRKVSFTYDARVLQPGQPTSQSWDLENPVSAQVPVIVVSAQGDDGHIKSAVFDIDNSFHLPIPVPLYAGQSLVLNDNGFARLYDKKGRLIKQITLDQNLPLWNVGRHTLTFDGPTDDNSPVTLKIDVKLADKNEALGRLN